MAARYTMLQESLNDPDLLTNPTRLVATSKEAGQLETIVNQYREYIKASENVNSLTVMAENKADAEMAELAALELDEATASADAQLEALKDEFAAAEDNAVNSFFLEIRAGTGGEEAALFCRVLYEMYKPYCERNGWRFDVNDFSPSDRGGFKEVIINIKGKGAYRHLRFEGGGHRVQRVPETEAQGRIHTSAATAGCEDRGESQGRGRVRLPRRRARWAERQQS
jgi:peptide chain release factor 1